MITRSRGHRPNRGHVIPVFPKHNCISGGNPKQSPSLSPYGTGLSLTSYLWYVKKKSTYWIFTEVTRSREARSRTPLSSSLPAHHTIVPRHRFLATVPVGFGPDRLQFGSIKFADGRESCASLDRGDVKPTTSMYAFYASLTLGLMLTCIT